MMAGRWVASTKAAAAVSAASAKWSTLSKRFTTRSCSIDSLAARWRSARFSPCISSGANITIPANGDARRLFRSARVNAAPGWLRGSETLPRSRNFAAAREAYLCLAAVPIPPSAGASATPTPAHCGTGLSCRAWQGFRGRKVLGLHLQLRRSTGSHVGRHVRARPRRCACAGYPSSKPAISTVINIETGTARSQRASKTLLRLSMSLLQLAVSMLRVRRRQTRAGSLRSPDRARV